MNQNNFFFLWCTLLTSVKKERWGGLLFSSGCGCASFDPMVSCRLPGTQSLRVPVSVKSKVVWSASLISPDDSEVFFLKCLSPHLSYIRFKNLIYAEYA